MVVQIVPASPQRLSPAAQALLGFQAGREERLGREREAAEFAEERRRFDIQEAGRAATRRQQALEARNNLIVNMTNAGYILSPPTAAAVPGEDVLGAPETVPGKLSRGEDITIGELTFTKAPPEEPEEPELTPFQRLQKRQFEQEEEIFQTLLERAETDKERKKLMEARLGLKIPEPPTASEARATQIETDLATGKITMEDLSEEDKFLLTGRVPTEKGITRRVPGFITKEREDEILERRGLSEPLIGFLEPEEKKRARTDIQKMIREINQASMQGIAFVPTKTEDRELEIFKRQIRKIEKEQGLPVGSLIAFRDEEGNVQSVNTLAEKITPEVEPVVPTAEAVLEEIVPEEISRAEASRRAIAKEILAEREAAQAIRERRIGRQFEAAEVPLAERKGRLAEIQRRQEELARERAAREKREALIRAAAR